ncbi:uncharacterized protein LOC119349976 [Triticum dicoccoides]|uniref:uncharacterized protein LOC119349976 n=1 Tax=Triticum dicoccoides TaxID=85692 RepID=UPI00188E5AF9|nr:uncharacterized protein LOC119349976 [Triticum dicoccoides]
MSMEASSWVVPCYSGWSMEEAAAWSSDHRISFQTSLPSGSDSGMQLQVVEYAAPATPTHDTCTDQDQVLKEVVQAFNADYLDIMEKKMHRFPPSLVDVDGRYKVPVTVAIGPYHHGHPGMLEAERVKHVAASQCVTDSGRSLQELYSVVCSVSDDARSLYYHNEAAGKYMGNDDFLPMMFFDGCFLVQFMRWYYVHDDEFDQALVSYFYANFERIYTDIMMLENQIPWVVVETIFRFMPPGPSPWPWEMFVAAMRRGLKNQMVDQALKKEMVGDVHDIDVDPDYEPPHLLGLVRFYIVGNYDKDNNVQLPSGEKPTSSSISVAELADVGITLVPKKETEAVLVDMRLQPKWGCFSDLFVPPLCLTEANATWLVNMAAFELCRTPDFDNVGAENSAVCSYLHLFAMLLDQKEHVHDLRKKKVIDGGGLTSKATLEYFTSIGKNMRIGKCYLDIIIEIQKFKRERSFLLKPYRFFMKNRTKFMAVISIIGVVIGILSSLQALKQR